MDRGTLIHESALLFLRSEMSVEMPHKAYTLPSSFKEAFWSKDRLWYLLFVYGYLSLQASLYRSIFNHFTVKFANILSCFFIKEITVFSS